MSEENPRPRLEGQPAFGGKIYLFKIDETGNAVPMPKDQLIEGYIPAKGKNPERISVPVPEYGKVVFGRIHPDKVNTDPKLVNVKTSKLKPGDVYVKIGGERHKFPHVGRIAAVVTQNAHPKEGQSGGFSVLNVSETNNNVAIRSGLEDSQNMHPSIIHSPDKIIFNHKDINHASNAGLTIDLFSQDSQQTEHLNVQVQGMGGDSEGVAVKTLTFSIT